jgi:hypothetical protein
MSAENTLTGPGADLLTNPTITFIGVDDPLLGTTDPTRGDGPLNTPLRQLHENVGDLADLMANGGGGTGIRFTETVTLGPLELVPQDYFVFPVPEGYAVEDIKIFYVRTDAGLSNQSTVYVYGNVIYNEEDNTVSFPATGTPAAADTYFVCVFERFA